MNGDAMTQRKPKILPDGQTVATDGPQILQDGLDLVVPLAQAEHQGRLCIQMRPGGFGHSQ